MADQITSQQAAATKKLTELTLLYQFSNTMLSTLRLNKLTHLILTALTYGEPMLFERAILFLRNEKSGVLQGMLGISQDSSEALQIIGGDDALSSRWDISEESIVRQRTSDLCSLVRATRLEIDNDCPVIRRVIFEQKLILVEEDDCHDCASCNFSKKIGAKSFAAAPLVARGKSLGIIVVDNPHSEKLIINDDLHFLKLFANQAGMAIENSMLYHHIEEAHTNLQEARERLVHGERLAAIGEMAANLVHELKNPLITIGGFAGRMLKVLPEGSREHRYTGMIVSEVCRLEKMLSDILAFSRKPTICYSACELGEILQDCLDNCAATLEDHNIRLVSDHGAAFWPLVGDAHQLKQVFLNLILNACEVMPTGGQLTVHVESLPREKRAVKVRISDTGGGIPSEMLSQIFTPFFTTKQNGTGLGLSIVNRILQNHNGRIEAANQGPGAVFTVLLPLAEPVE
jgi:signal transduction histidine kinase